MSAYSEKDVLYVDNCATALSDAELENVFGGGGPGYGLGGPASGSAASALSNSFTPVTPTNPFIIIVNSSSNDDRRQRRRRHDDYWGNDGWDDGGSDN